MPAPPPRQVLFPVVDSVLGQITQEYEKRLLQKDHDLAAARDRAAAAQREASEMQARGQGGRNKGGARACGRSCAHGGNWKPGRACWVRRTWSSPWRRARCTRMRALVARSSAAPQNRLQQVQDEWQRENTAAACAAANVATAAAASLHGEVEALQAALRQRDAALRDREDELAKLQGRDAEGARARAAREKALQAQLEDARCAPGDGACLGWTGVVWALHPRTRCASSRTHTRARACLTHPPEGASWQRWRSWAAATGRWWSRTGRCTTRCRTSRAAYACSAASGGRRRGLGQACASRRQASAVASMQLACENGRLRGGEAGKVAGRGSLDQVV
jgi:hypothetical protein